MNLSVFTVWRTEKALPRLSLVGTVLHAASFSWTLADGRQSQVIVKAGRGVLLYDEAQLL